MGTTEPGAFFVYPRILATRVGRIGDEQSAVFYCRHCRVFHYHGVDGIPGHKSARCANPDSPYRKTGYILVFKRAEANVQ